MSLAGGGDDGDAPIPQGTYNIDFDADPFATKTKVGSSASVTSASEMPSMYPPAEGRSNLCIIH